MTPTSETSMLGLRMKKRPMMAPATLNGSSGLDSQVARWKASALTMPMPPASSSSQPTRLHSAAVALKGRKIRNSPSAMPASGRASISQRMCFMAVASLLTLLTFLRVQS